MLTGGSNTCRHETAPTRYHIGQFGPHLPFSSPINSSIGMHIHGARDHQELSSMETRGTTSKIARNCINLRISEEQSPGRFGPPAQVLLTDSRDRGQSISSTPPTRRGCVSPISKVCAFSLCKWTDVPRKSWSLTSSLLLHPSANLSLTGD